MRAVVSRHPLSSSISDPLASRSSISSGGCFAKRSANAKPLLDLRNVLGAQIESDKRLSIDELGSRNFYTLNSR